jgi:DNA-binding GntR family transcriptional regulator
MDNKIPRTFVRQEAYAKLRNWILDGTLSPGTQLRDKVLAEQLGVSRTPIREALLRLEDEGLVKTKPNSSTLVSSIDFHNAFHLYIQESSSLSTSIF